MSDHIAGYDMRNLNGGPFIRLHRPGRTQQRMTFDVDWAGRYLTTGGTDGVIRVYDVDVGGSSEAMSQVQAHQGQSSTPRSS
jgi:WD40 repeat protein